MNKDNNNTAIQAMPVTVDTVVGIQTNLDTADYSVVHCEADTTLTFTFPSKSIVINALEGMDFGIGKGCISLTSTASVIVS